MARTTLVLPREEGGLGLYHPKIRCRALWIKHLHMYIVNDAVWSPIAKYWCALPLHRFNRNKWSNSEPHSSEASGLYDVAIPDTKKFYPSIQNPDIKTFTKKCYQLILSSGASIPRIAEKRTIRIVKPIWEKNKNIPSFPRKQKSMVARQSRCHQL